MTSPLEELKKGTIPRHVAIIMDGNGRWAKSRGKERIEGHQMGAVALRKAIEASLLMGVRYLTVYAFSLENWNRSVAEVEGLMALFVKSCQTELPLLQKHHVAFKAIGNLKLLNEQCQTAIKEIEMQTSKNTALTLQVALSYGSRWEIANAAKEIAIAVKEQKLSIDQIDETVFSNYLLTKDVPDPDLLIRTSGEYRISNYLLWQIAYSELYFCDCYWPDFTEKEYFLAVADFQRRERRYGKTSEQITNSTK